MPKDARTDSPLQGEVTAELLTIVGEIAGILDPEELFRLIAQKLRRIIDYRILDIFLPDADGLLSPAHVEGYDIERAKRLCLRVGEGIVGRAALSREPVFVPDVSRDERYISCFPGLSAELAIPLLGRNGLVGVLNVEGPSAEAFTPAARGALQVLAGHLAAAIQNATLYRETRRYADLLATLGEVGRETASILDLDLLLQRLAEIVKRVIDYEMFGILLLEEEREELVLRKAVNFGPGREKSRLPVSEGLCGAAVRGRAPVLVGDVRRDPRYVGLVPETRSELVVPLMVKDRVIGVFDLESPKLDRFTDEHVQVLTPLAGQVATAVENARLYAEIVARDERISRELRIAQEIQHALFPEGSPGGQGWQASAHFRPARELGGDLYDFYDMGGGLVGVAAGDVAGKGVPAALYAAFVSGLLRRRAYERHPPAQLMERMNRTLRRRGVEGLFCTLAYALFDFQDGVMRVANSGLPPPIHYRASKKRAAPIAVAGLPLGTFDSAVYDEVRLELEAGDIIVFYSDGLVEARARREEYGIERLIAATEAHAALEARALGERLRAGFDEFLADEDPADDVTLIVIKTL